MNKNTGFELVSNPEVKRVFNAYPKNVQVKMNKLRSLVLEAAEELEQINKVEETLKWGEPSYLTKHGSTIRMDWKTKSPDEYAIYFKCTSKLVPSFKEKYPDTFTYESNRAIHFKLDEKIPERELKKCIQAALLYHKVKHLPLLDL